MATASHTTKLSHAGNHGCQPTPDEDPKPLHSEHYSAEPATAYENQKLSQSEHRGAHPETTTRARVTCKLLLSTKDGFHGSQ
jgi:hypothetical protein